jgi:DNA-binding transcriptional MerR regulator
MQLMSIGRFSRLTGLGVKALRHYDEIGLLPPAAIRRLRRLDLPLEDVQRLLASDDPREVREVLVSHQRRLAWRTVQLDAARRQIQHYIDGKETIMGTRSEALGTDQHRQLGIDLFNRTWTLMEKGAGTPEEADELAHSAHASAYHWIHGGGTPANRARSEWQCSRVYVVLGRVEPALHHARRCLAICESAPEEMEAWDLPFAYEALARAHALAGAAPDSRTWLARAREAGALIEDEEDRAHLESDLATIPS